MVVKPQLRRHPKFLGLARKVGGSKAALWILHLLWEHCEVMRKFNWGNVGADYVEMVVEWKGKAGVCFEALCNPFGTPISGGPSGTLVGGRGWVDLTEGQVVIHEWESFNKTLVESWLKGEETRRKWEVFRRTGLWPESDGNSHGRGKAGAKAPVRPVPKPVPKQQPEHVSGSSQGEKNGVEKNGVEVPPYPPPSSVVGEPGKNGGPAPPDPGAETAAAPDAKIAADGEETEAENGEENLAQIPDAAEMFEHFQATGQPVTREVCVAYENWCQRKDQWLIRNGLGQPIVRKWKLEVPRWQLDQRRGYKTAQKEENAAAEIEKIRAELQWQKNPEKSAALALRWRELEGKT